MSHSYFLHERVPRGRPRHSRTLGQPEVILEDRQVQRDVVRHPQQTHQLNVVRRRQRNAEVLQRLPVRRQRTFRVDRDGLLQLTERHVRGDHQRRLRHERPFLLPNLNLQPKLGGFAVRLVFGPPPSSPLEHRRRRKHLPQRRVNVRRAEGRPRDSREPTHEVFIEHVRVDGPEINGPLSLLTAATAAAATCDVPRVRPAAVAQLREQPAEVGGKAAGERVDGHARHDHRRETGDAGAAAHGGHDRVA
mmetsp:Transcript_4188/g.18977  ORF Transcript_4188/g.18977 Transcript_4188/m.18977 type:complete len:248 (-) Transcript_4188:212-955(-)